VQEAQYVVRGEVCFRSAGTERDAEGSGGECTENDWLLKLQVCATGVLYSERIVSDQLQFGTRRLVGTT
jgi:hypothetical protein